MISTDQISKLLGRKVDLFHTLEEAQLRKVSALLRERRFRKGEVIFHQHDPGGCMYFILSGEVRIFLSSSDGREATICIYKDQTAFGEFSVIDDRPRSASAAALCDLTTLVLYKEDFLPLMRANFDLTLRIMSMLTERLRYTTNYTEQLAFLSATGRVATLLVKMARYNGEALPTRLNITQQQIAEHANISRELVNRVLREFADARLIAIERGAVIVRDLHELERRIERS
jgi:CRP/FNR family cyclic AMP-dependent transcriptional regulator